MIVRIILLLTGLALLPFVIGMLYTRWHKQPENGILCNWIAGVVIIWAILQLLIVPCTYLKIRFTTVTIAALALLVVLIVISLWINRDRCGKVCGKFIETVRHTPWITLLLFCVIGFQIYMYTFYMHVDDDDAFYLATSTTTIQSDSLYQVNPYTGDAYATFPARYVLSPFPVFIAFLSKVSGIHAAVLAHTILPAVLLVAAYGVFGMIGMRLFEQNREKTAYFVLIAAVIQMFSLTTARTQGTVMLIRIWQGKAVLASTLLPLLFYMGMKLYWKEWEKADWVFLVSILLACCLVSSMGIMLGAIMTGIMGLIVAIRERRLRTLIGMLLCCIPNLLYAGIYLVIR